MKPHAHLRIVATTPTERFSRRMQALIAGTTDVMTLAEAAVVSMRSMSTLRRAINAGELPATKASGGHLAIAMAELTAYRRRPKPLSPRRQAILEAILPQLRHLPDALHLAA